MSDATNEKMDQQLGDDIAAIRARVLGKARASARASSYTPKEREAVDIELRARVQVDLDRDPGALAELEDPRLTAHIAAQRRALQEYRETLKAIPTRGALNEKYVAAIGTMSEMVASLDTQTREVNDWATMAHKRAEALAFIKAAGTPRNAPPNPWKVLPKGADEFLAFFEGEAATTARDFDKAKDLVAGCHRTVFKLRREFEYVVDNLLKRVDALEDERRRLREHLRDVAPAARAKK